MSIDSESWGPPAESKPLSAQDHLEARYADRMDPEDLDDMVFLAGEKPQMIEVPHWSSAPEDGSEAEVAIEESPFTVGRELTIMRSAKGEKDTVGYIPAYEEGGWKIVDSNSTLKNGESGQINPAVIVEKTVDGMQYTKRVSKDEVLSLNPESKPALSGPEEDVAELAIEIATGIEDPSEVGDDARMFSVAELKAMRDASRRIVGESVPEVELPVESTPERKERNGHLKVLFAPPERPEVPASKVDLYDTMFSSEEGVHEAAVTARHKEDQDNEPVLKAQKDFDRITNQDTREYSEQQLAAVMRRDSGIRELLAAKGFNEASIAAVDALREDEDLRYAVGEHFLRKLNNMVEEDISTRGTTFGDRLKSNGQKNNDYIRLPVTTSSREYAAYLALAKVSGMFNYKVDTSDVFKDQDGKGKIVLNQHRHAADMLL